MQGFLDGGHPARSTAAGSAYFHASGKDRATILGANPKSIAVAGGSGNGPSGATRPAK
nr:hypothetical protein [Amycolatopsis sp. TNS106]